MHSSLSLHPFPMDACPVPHDGRLPNTVLSKVIYKNSYTNTINAPRLLCTLSTQFLPPIEPMVRFSCTPFS